ncbi:MAG: hypothetical protein AAGA56_27695 [Myxococcota bacterium]
MPRIHSRIVGLLAALLSLVGASVSCRNVIDTGDLRFVDEPTYECNAVTALRDAQTEGLVFASGFDSTAQSLTDFGDNAENRDNFQFIHPALLGNGLNSQEPFVRASAPLGGIDLRVGTVDLCLNRIEDPRGGHILTLGGQSRGRLTLSHEEDTLKVSYCTGDNDPSMALCEGAIFADASRGTYNIDPGVYHRLTARWNLRDVAALRFDLLLDGVAIDPGSVAELFASPSPDGLTDLVLTIGTSVTEAPTGVATYDEIAVYDRFLDTIDPVVLSDE